MPDCPVCFNPLRTGTTVRHGGCNRHCLCRDCARRIYITGGANSDRCPICRDRAPLLVVGNNLEENATVTIASFNRINLPQRGLGGLLIDIDIQ